MDPYLGKRREEEEKGPASKWADEWLKAKRKPTRPVTDKHTRLIYRLIRSIAEPPDSILKGQALRTLTIDKHIHRHTHTHTND